MNVCGQFELDKIRWQLCEYDPTYIASFGIKLKNGEESPMFSGIDAFEPSEIKELQIPKDQQINRIRVEHDKSYYET